VEKVKLVSLSTILSLIFTAFQVAININYKLNTLWQVSIFRNLAELYFGPPLILGFRENGIPIHEGSPVDILTYFLGLGFGIIFYTLVIVVITQRIKR